MADIKNYSIKRNVNIGNATEAGNVSGKTYKELYEALTDGTSTNLSVSKVTAAKISATAQSVTPAADSGSGSTVNAGVVSVVVGAVTNDADDWIVLPSLADVDNGHTITILCSAGANFEMRTPAASAEEINSEDCDGTKEYLMTDTQVVKVIKINDTIGWMAHGFSAIGAVVTAVVPD